MKKTWKILFLVLIILATAMTTFLATILWYDGRTALQMETAPVEAKVQELGQLLEQYYIDMEDVDPEALTTAAGDGAAAAMLAATGDRWSYYIPASELALHNELSENSYVGIGVTIREVENGEEIMEVTVGGPAEEAGLQVGDILVEVDGHAVAGLEPGGTRDLVRGEEGSFVSICVLRKEERLEFEVERRAIITPAAEYELLEGGVGYIRILNFDAHCAEHTLGCIEEALADGAESLLFDVRFNGGGYKHEMVQILDALLPEGDIFRSVDYRGKEEVDTSDANCLEIPMAVLVNEDSYSAAEFFAAALQEYGVATVVGTQTSGKGNFQYTFDLSDGSAVAISCGKYVTPQGKSLTNVGITPDVQVDLSDEDYENLYYGVLEHGKDSQLQAALEVLAEKAP